MPDTEGTRVKNSHVVTYTFRKRLSTRVKEQFKSLHPNLSLHFLIMFFFLNSGKRPRGQYIPTDRNYPVKP